MKSKKLSGYLPLIISPLAVAASVLIVFRKIGLYPFGERTAAWCDMNQQVVPLLCQFKDILDGRSGMLLSFKNASGMSFWGVFFFFLASPFTFLVKFVDKSDMLLFVNILILLKMMLCAFTASLYFIVSKEHKRLDPASISLLGFIYATSGYVMLFYQNVIWLDMMYLFPLLLISLDKLRRKNGSPLMYSFVMAAMMIVNYYIGYMIVVFLLLTGFAYVLIYRGQGNYAAVCRRFLTGSGLAALMSAIVWLPSFLQFLSSGRKTSLADSLRTGELVTDYDTVLPVMMCSAALLIFAVCGLLAKRRSNQFRLRAAVFALLCVPLFIEPINKMWHTGSYMSFPARYAFMTLFFALIFAAYELEQQRSFDGDLKKYAVGIIASAAALLAYKASTESFINESTGILSEYTKTLGGNEVSFKALGRLLMIGLLCIGVVYFFYRRGWILKSLFLIFVCAVTFIESFSNVRIYMTTAGERSEETNALQREVFDLEDRIDDSGFYRVKTSAKIFDYNMVGAMGYNSIGHYTSLTDEDYMFAMKRMGYTSVWMEVGTCGGTELTDALLSIGYEISHADRGESVYSNKGYYINPLETPLPLGVISAQTPEEEIPEHLTRAQVQQYIFNEVFGDGELIRYYEPAEGEYIEYPVWSGLPSGFAVAEGERLIYRFDVTGSQTLYFDCFDELTNELSEPIYDSFSVTVNGMNIIRRYPYSKENGVLKLGSFNDERVVVEIETLKDVNCRSFGVFGLDTGLLAQGCADADTIGFSEVKNGLTGSYSGDGGAALLSVPYDRGFTVKINGEKIPYRRALSGFIAFDLPSGESDIEISFSPSGFVPGAALSVCGLIAALAYFPISRCCKKLRPVKSVDKACAVILFVLGAAVTAAVYVLPLIANILFWKKE